MRKKYSTLTEEINRMKSLFTEERLYGNIVEKQLLTEGNVFKYLGKAFANSSAPAVKSLGHIRVNKAFSSAIDNFAGLSKHLDDFDDVWKAMGLTGDELRVSKGTIKNLADLESSGVLSKFDLYKEVNGFRPIETISTKGGLRETVMLKYWDDTGIKPPPSQYASPPSKIDNPSTVTMDGSGLIRLTDSNGVVKTLDSGGGKVETFTPTKTESKEDFAARVNKSVGWASGGRKMTVADLDKMVGEGQILITVRDGQWKRVEEVKTTNVKVDGDVVLEGPPSSVKGVKKSLTPWRLLRYIFPTYMFGLKKVVKFIKVGVEAIPNQGPKIGKYLDWFGEDRITLTWKATDKNSTLDLGRKGVENFIRVVGVEQLALMSINTALKSEERGKLSGLYQSWSDYLAGRDSIGWYNAVWLATFGVVAGLTDLGDMRKNSIATCQTNCDNKSSEDPDINNKDCFEACSEGVNDFFDKKDDLAELVIKYKELVKEYDLSNISNWDDNQIKKYCEDENGAKVKITEVLTDMTTKVKEIESEIDDYFDTDFMKATLAGMNLVLGIDMGTTEDIKNEVFGTDPDGNTITSGKIVEVQNELDQTCIDYWNQTPIDGGKWNNPGDDEESEEEEDRLFGQITVEIEPIQLIA